MTFTLPSEQSITCDCERDKLEAQDSMLRQARDEHNLFLWGVLVSDEGRQTVIKLMQRGYARGTAMRIALQAEASRV